MSDSTLTTIKNVPADVVIEISDALWHQVDLPAIFGSGLTVSALDSAGEPVGFMVAWPSSAAAEGGVVAETTNARYITPLVIAGRYELPGPDDRSPRAPHVLVGLRDAPVEAVRFELTVD